MDKVQEDFNKASLVLLDAESKLRVIQAQRTQLEKEIAILSFVEANLEENIRVLRRKRAIVMATEYKKAMNDLQTAKSRKAFLRIDRDNALKIESHAEKIHLKAKQDYEKAFKMLHNPPNNVIRINFGKKDGQK